MELKITENGFIQKIENFEELKKELTERTEKYKSLVYTDEQISNAKADRASLRKLVEALEAKRKEYKNHCLKPYEDFEKDVKSLVSIVNEPITIIDKQVKAFEDEQKAVKRVNIESYFNGYNPFEWLRFEQIFNDKWLNSSFKTEKVVEEINGIIEQIKIDLDTLSKIPDFSFESIEVYKDTIDLNKALSEALRLSEMQKKKTEQKKVEKAPAEKQPEQLKMWVAFEAHLSPDDAAALRDFFLSRGIKYNSIQRKEV